jgi:MFS family permease
MTAAAPDSGAAVSSFLCASSPPSPDPGGGGLAFGYHRSVGPQLGMLLGIAIAETVVVHILVTAIWGWRAALVVGLVDLATVMLLVRLLRAMRARPVTIVDGMVTVRAGFIGERRFPASAIVAIRTDISAADARRPGVLNLALVAHPNIALVLSPPLPGRRYRRPIDTVVHRLDDTAAFIAAIDALGAGHGRPA